MDDKIEFGYLRDLLSEHDYVSEMASSYAKVKGIPYKNRIEKYNIKNHGYGEMVNSVLGSIIVGTVTFVFNMIVNCIKYLALTIKAIVVDSQIIPNIINGITSLLEASGDYYGPVRIINYLDVDKHMEGFEKRIQKREKILKDINDRSHILDKLEAIIDPEIIRDRRILDVKYLERNAINDKEFDKFISSLRNGYTSFNRVHDAEKLRFDKEITVKTLVDRNKHLVKMKNSLSSYYTDIYPLYIEYLERVNKVLDAEQALLEKLQERKGESFTMEETVFVRTTEVVIPYFISDMKNMSETCGFYKRELVGALLALTEDYRK